MAVCGVAELEIADRMVKTVRSADSVYREQLETKRERQDTTALEKKKKRAATLIKLQEKKQQGVLTEAQLETFILQEEINSLKL